MNSNCSNLLDMRNLQEQVKKHTVTKNCSDLSLFDQIVLVISKISKNSWPSAPNFKSFSQSLEQFYLTEGQTNYGKRIPVFLSVIEYIYVIMNSNNYLCREQI